MRPVSIEIKELHGGTPIAPAASAECSPPTGILRVAAPSPKPRRSAEGTGPPDSSDDMRADVSMGKRGKDRGGEFDGSRIPADAEGGTAVRYARRPIPPKLYRIGELFEYSGMSRQTVDNYTTMGLLTEARRTEGGHRLYDESVFARLDLIVEMKSHGRSLREIRECFAKVGSP